MSKVYVIGHKNPDTDTIVAAIGYAYFKGQVDKDDEYIPARTGELNGETKFVLDKFNIPVPELLTDASGKKIILVDHNEMGQVVNGTDKATILEIIDHHRLGDIQTSAPIMFHAEPVGSTSTIITDFLLYHKISIPKGIAGVLLAGILSDTVIFKSPTTTEKDKRMGEELNKILKLDIQSFGMEVKSAKSSIKGMTPNEVITKDFKEHEKNNTKYGVGQIEVVHYNEALERKDELINELKNIKEAHGYKLCILMVTNIIDESSKIWFAGDKEIIKKALGKEPKNNELFLPGVMSRKKQITPKIQDAL
jgi:manganese-dependent inorganic pyrophosphatase